MDENVSHECWTMLPCRKLQEYATCLRSMLIFETSACNEAEMLPPVRLPKYATPVKATHPYHPPHHLCDLDMAWLKRSNPHRESGTRFGLRQTLDRQGGSSRSAEGDAGTGWATPLEQDLARACSASTKYGILAERTRTSVSVSRICI